MQKHRTSKQEIASLRALVERDLQDAALQQLSSDRRFATAYNAALQTANMAIACAGYRITAKTGHHRAAIECIRLVFGKSATNLADYLETCRRKRNLIDYMHSNIASASEANEIVFQAKSFQRMVVSWIAKNYPAMA